MYADHVRFHSCRPYIERLHTHRSRVMNVAIMNVLCPLYIYTSDSLWATLDSVFLVVRRLTVHLIHELKSVMCSFDGGALENCSLALLLDLSRFASDNHTVVLTGIDVFGQTDSVSLSFRVSILCKTLRLKSKPVLTVIISPANFSKCGMSAVRNI